MALTKTEHKTQRNQMHYFRFKKKKKKLNNKPFPSWPYKTDSWIPSGER